MLCNAWVFGVFNLNHSFWRRRFRVRKMWKIIFLGFSLVFMGSLSDFCCGQRTAHAFPKTKQAKVIWALTLLTFLFQLPTLSFHFIFLLFIYLFILNINDNLNYKRKRFLVHMKTTEKQGDYQTVMKART